MGQPLGTIGTIGDNRTTTATTSAARQSFAVIVVRRPTGQPSADCSAAPPFQSYAVLLVADRRAEQIGNAQSVHAEQTDDGDKRNAAPQRIRSITEGDRPLKRDIAYYTKCSA